MNGGIRRIWRKISGNLAEEKEKTKRKEGHTVGKGDRTGDRRGRRAGSGDAGTDTCDSQTGIVLHAEAGYSGMKTGDTYVVGGSHVETVAMSGLRQSYWDDGVESEDWGQGVGVGVGGG